MVHYFLSSRRQLCQTLWKFCAYNTFYINNQSSFYCAQKTDLAKTLRQLPQNPQLDLSRISKSIGGAANPASPPGTGKPGTTSTKKSNTRNEVGFYIVLVYASFSKMSRYWGMPDVPHDSTLDPMVEHQLGDTMHPGP